MEPILGGDPDWFANEVFAGTGMQKMDVLCMRMVSSSNREFRPIELKAGEGESEDLEQLRRYIWWIKDYIWKEGDMIQPVWISRGFRNLNDANNRARKIADEEDCEIPQTRYHRYGRGD